MYRVLIRTSPSRKQLEKNCILYKKFVHGGLASKLNLNLLCTLLDIYCRFHKIVLVECHVEGGYGKSQLIGSSLYTQSRLNKSIYTIKLLAVHNRYRRKRIGSQLLTSGEHYIKNNALYASIINTRTINSEENKAINFYLKNGFQINLNSKKKRFLELSKSLG